MHGRHRKNPKRKAVSVLSAKTEMKFAESLTRTITCLQIDPHRKTMDLRKKFAEFMKNGKEDDTRLQDRIRELEFQLHDARQRLAAAQFKVPEMDL